MGAAKVTFKPKRFAFLILLTFASLSYWHSLAILNLQTTITPGCPPTLAEPTGGRRLQQSVGDCNLTTG
jgi:hypothetical protein